jgi:hypothetical protein
LTLRNQLASYGFATETSQSYGGQQLPPRRHAFFATRRPNGLLNCVDS